MFPRITDCVQQYFEKENGSAVPELCGYKGRACRQMNSEEGANRMLCMSCPLKEFSDKNRLLAEKENIFPTDNVIEMADGKLGFTFTLWFDVDRVFGTETKEDDTTWVNLYSYYDTNTKEVSYEVMLDTPYGLQKVDYSFTEAEKLMLFDMMNEQYKKLTGNPLAA